MKKFFIISLFFFILFLFSGCKQETYNKIELKDAFQTINSVELFTTGSISKDELKTLKEDINKILEDLDNLFNIQERNGIKPNTTLSLISQRAGIEPVTVSSEVIFVIKKALEMAEISKIQNKDKEIALFDPSISPAWKIWDFPNNQYDYFDNTLTVTEINDIETKVKEIVSCGLVNYKNIVVDEEKSTVFLAKAGMEIDLGAIAKGYAADKVKEYLINRGYTSSIINIGGNILTIGDLFEKSFRIGIRTPYINWTNLREDENGDYLNHIFGRLEVKDMSVVTSGTYEKYIRDEEGKEYHHILDPETGLPIDNNVISITVVTKESILADGYSTTLFALGLDKGMEVVNATEDLETVWVVKNGKTKEVYISSGLEESF